MSRLLSIILLICLLFVVCCVQAAQETLLTKEQKLRICTQNLFNYGLTNEGSSGNSKRISTQRSYLVERMSRAKCDIIAVQEVVGGSEQEAKARLDQIAQALSARTHRSFKAYVKDSLDERIRNGFLVADDSGELRDLKSYTDVNLPKLSLRGASRKFSRGPLALIIDVPIKDGEGHLSPTVNRKKTFLIITMHLKSKADAWRDPTNTQFETLRMEMAEGLRQLAFKEISNLPPSSVLVILGDRNSDRKSAAADVLSGRRELLDFSLRSKCSVNYFLNSSCGENQPHDPQLIELFSLRRDQLGRQFGASSYKFKKKYYLIDEILIRPKDLSLVTPDKKSYSIGIEGQFYRGSDHKLLWAEFNW